jgi:phosphoribosylformylglycinamidine cyclo-ligase
VQNTERVLPAGCRLTIDRSTWTPPDVFTWLGGLGDVDVEEMFRVFNMGIGMTFIVRPENASKVQETIRATGIDCWRIGDVQASEKSAEV